MDTNVTVLMAKCLMKTESATLAMSLAVMNVHLHQQMYVLNALVIGQILWMVNVIVGGHLINRIQRDIVITVTQRDVLPVYIGIIIAATNAKILKPLWLMENVSVLREKQ